MHVKVAVTTHALVFKITSGLVIFQTGL